MQRLFHCYRKRALRLWGYAVSGGWSDSCTAILLTSATTSKRQWAISLNTSTTKPSDASCSCGITQWARTVTCSAASDPSLSPHSWAFPKGKAFFYLESRVLSLIACSNDVSPVFINNFINFHTIS